MRASIGKTLLLVEDEGLIALASAQKLQRFGYTVRIASTGEDAVKTAVIDGGIDLILMDINLGEGISGTDAAKKILSRCEIPIVFLTSHAEKEYVDKVRKISRYGYIIKDSGDFVLQSSIEMAFELFHEHKLLQENEEWFEALFQNAPLSYQSLDENGRFLFVNDAWLETFGYERSEVVGKWFGDLLPQDRVSSFQEKFPRFKKEGKVHTEFPLKSKDGSIKFIDFVGRIGHDQTGNFKQTHCILSDVTERKKAENDLERIKWLLKSLEFRKADLEASPRDLTESNTNRTILDGVGPENLQKILSEFIILLGTSAAVYETNGDYAAGLFSSGWCRTLDEASFQLCGTDSAALAMKSGQWHCHESCWKTASRASMERNEPVDIACSGGIHLYAVPIRIKNEIIGSMNFGYGSPPQNKADREKIAGLYSIDAGILETLSLEYEERPQFIIDYAKKKIEGSASLIGLIVENHRILNALQISEERTKTLLSELQHRVKNSFAVISSLLSMEETHSGSPENRESLEKIANRIDSISELYTLFSSSDSFKYIRLDTYCKKILHKLAHSLAGSGTTLTSVEIDCEIIEIDTSRAVAVGLILNELVTNAFKHAFPPGKTGKVRVLLSADGEDILLRVEDTGKGLPAGFDSAKSTGLGMMIVQALTNQLEGTFHTGKGKGSCFTITFAR